MLKHTTAALMVLSLGFLGCDQPPSPAPAASGKAATTGAPTAAAPATAAATATAIATAEPAKEETAADKEHDLSGMGDAWKGFKITAPGDAIAKDDGAGGISLAMKAGLQVSISKGPALMKDIKDGAEAGAKFGGGKVEFTTDTADTLDYWMEGKDPAADKAVKAWGFALNVEVDGKKYGCSGAGIFEEPNVAKLKDICKSLKK